MADMRGSSSNIGVGDLGAGTGGLAAVANVLFGGNGGGGPCGACKFLRRKCITGCIFAPYFRSDRGAECFTMIHKVFGASNVSKLLACIPPHRRRDAVITICFEAQCRIRDPVYGCVSQILALQQQVMNLQNEVSYMHAHIATLELPSPPSLTPRASLPPSPPPLSIWDIPSASNLPATFDVAAIMDSTPPQSPWSLPQEEEQPQQQREQHEQQILELRQLVNSVGEGSFIENTSEGEDLQSLANELIERNNN